MFIPFAKFFNHLILEENRQDSRIYTHYAKLCSDMLNQLEKPDLSWKGKYSNVQFSHIKELFQEMLDSVIFNAADRADYNTRTLRFDLEYYLGKASYPGFGLEARSDTMKRIISFLKTIQRKLAEEAEFCQVS